ncbi:phosphate ABC transporter substrate-binding protein PstS [Pseudomonas monteilii]|jgi:phosphate transport system substrate-binding protein|uniref:Phosphate-binding protein PstS n=4 Tax=Pseudomonas TaxID=286 RepID=A0A177JWC4_9PSED|nr:MULTISPECIES: phosphate ABC transporter substrate-binding protein PstS [Pseudomonas]AVH39141.1 phosphate ABC transporter substrate-binding protein PstS [Pseudomonas monteilii]AYN15816.1 phosphate ABC transporter substrate-binding protein PstS [Pseudomonas monteilii]AYO00523.1 phosphate ABC transporter substrate-binding protein PstS [Pseudomonas sp. LTGT-11-2Z]KPM62565.1 phosphate ABC transporter substrate-binding protein [Pseudomonas putida]MBA1314840.1 phosphate ABC transporter substrate-b
MKRLMKSAALAVAVSLCATSAAFASENVRLTGSGASFPAPIYLTWFKDFSKNTAGVTVDYQSKGSGAGVQDFLNKTVDFAASDSAMSEADIAKVGEGVQLLPMTAGEIVLAYNLPGNPKGLKLPRDVYSNIFLGKITQWNDPQIAAANPELKLPATPITVVVRADSSGTTAVFTKHLSAINADFKQGLGEGNTVNWPATDKFIKSPKNDGVTATVRQTPGAIGYIEYGFAKLAKVDFAVLQNKAGQYVVPNAESGAEALAAVNMPENLVAWLPDPTGAKSYPITSYTWMIFRKDNGNPAKAKAMREMVEYSLTKGQTIADSMGYIPLPPSVVDQVRKASANIQ